MRPSPAPVASVIDPGVGSAIGATVGPGLGATVDAIALPIKPLLRGASHRVAFLVAPFAGLLLMAVAVSRGGSALLASTVYAITLVALFGVSSSYHRCKGSPAMVLRWKRADHATIFLMIAGTYTPLCVLGVSGDTGMQMLALIWAGALLGVLRATLWHKAPRVISAGLYIALGWLMAGFLADVRAGIGDAMLALVLLGGVFYTLGAVIYALRWPDPRPQVFGYHEIFHVLVIAAAGCHFAFVLQLVRGL